MDMTWPDENRRDLSVLDRRRFPRGGRRVADLPHPIVCVKCQSLQVHGLGRQADRLWCECRRCGYVWRPGVLTAAAR
jgi:hypothetical protein